MGIVALPANERMANVKFGNDTLSVALRDVANHLEGAQRVRRRETVIPDLVLVFPRRFRLWVRVIRHDPILGETSVVLCREAEVVAA